MVFPYQMALIMLWISSTWRVFFQCHPTPFFSSILKDWFKDFALTMFWASYSEHLLFQPFPFTCVFLTTLRIWFPLSTVSVCMLEKENYLDNSIIIYQHVFYWTCQLKDEFKIVFDLYDRYPIAYNACQNNCFVI